MLAHHPEYLHSTKAIFAAARQDRADVVAFLLDLGTPIEVEDAKKQRPLHVAAANDAVRVAGLLIQRGAEVDPYELNYNNTPLDFAVYHDYPRMIELLIPHSRDVWNLTFVGALHRLRDVLTAEPHLAKVSWQTTPLFQLPEDEQNALEIAELFLEHGADPAFRSKNDGSTAAGVARKRGMRQVAALLEPPAIGRATPARTAEEYQRVARDFVNAYEGDTAALQRLNRHYGRSFTVRRFVRRNLAPRVRVPPAVVPRTEKLPAVGRSANRHRAGRRLWQLDRTHTSRVGRRAGARRGV